MKFGTVIVGGGKGERLGKDIPKCLYPIRGIPLMLLSILPFEQVKESGDIVLVVPDGFEGDIKSEVKKYGLSRVSNIVPGGAQRQDSVLKGLQAVQSNVDRVLIHDGARPLLTGELVRRMIESLKDEQAAVAALHVTDTMHTARGLHAYAGPDRRGLVAAQTPQGFDRKLILQAFERANDQSFKFTDEVMLIREMVSVYAAIVLGETANVKITRPDDLDFYDAMLDEKAKILEARK